MEKFIKYFVIIIIFYFESVFAQSLFKSNQFTSDNGLSQNTVRCIGEDSLGYLWIGTQDGLNKFDGYQFQIFRHNPEDSTTLNNSSITSLYTDSENTIWVGTLAGINHKSQKENLFISIKEWDVGKIKPLPSKYYPTLYKKYLLLATGKGLILFDKKNFKTKQIVFVSNDTINSKNMLIYCYTWQQNTGKPILWIGTRKYGLWRLEFSGLNIVNKSFISLHNYWKKHSNYEPEIYDLIFRNDTLWIASKAGLFYLNTNRKKLKINTWRPDDKTNFFSGMSVRCFFIDFQGNYWIGTMRNGLFRYCPSQKNIPEQINDEGILTIYQDQFHTLWVGTSGAGLFKYNLDQPIFNTYRPFPNQKTNSHKNHIWAIYQDNTGLIWLGTNYGIKFINLKNNNLTFAARIRKLEKTLSLLKNLQVRSIIPDNRGNLWIGTLEDGLFQFYIPQNTIFHYKHNAQNPNSLPGNIIYKLFVDFDQNLWIGMNINGLSRAIFDKNKIQAFHNYNNLLKIDNSNNLWILDIVQIRSDSSNYLWLATWQNGLIRMDLKTGKLKKFIAGKSDSLNTNCILTLHYSTKKNCRILWIGTYGGGLTKLDLDTYNFNNYTTKQGMANNIVYAILEDDSGNLWLSTNYGLSYFDVQNEKFINYDIRDGLQSMEFNLHAAFKNSDGKFFFGGVNGLNYFKPKNLINRIPPKLDIKRIIIFNKNGKKEYTFPLQRTIKLDYDQNSLQIEFVALHSKNPQKIQYAYQLAEWGTKWIPIGFQRKVTFMNLPAGHYNFRVRACNSDGVWNKKGIAFNIIISPPFWKSNFAFLIYFMLFLSLLYFLHRIKINEALKIERIKIQERLQVKKEIESDFHDELGIRLTKIIQFSNKLKLMPLNANESMRIIDKISMHARELDSELNEFLWEIDIKEKTLEDLIIQLKECSDNFFDENIIHFNLINHIKNPGEIILPFNWRRNIVKIFKEGMHNILKHSKHCKNVHLSFDVVNNTLRIVLADDGDGFCMEEIEPGKGLKNMQKRAQEIKAKLRIYTRKGQGTSIFFERKLS